MSIADRWMDEMEAERKGTYLKGARVEREARALGGKNFGRKHYAYRAQTYGFYVMWGQWYWNPHVGGTFGGETVMGEAAYV